MFLDVSIAISGQAGQGMQSISSVLARVFTRAGYYTYTYHDVMSRVRGGNNTSTVRIRSTQVYALKESMNLLIALDKEAVLRHGGKVLEKGALIYDGDKIKFEQPDKNYFPIPLEKLAIENGGDKVMVNSVATGAALAFLGGWNNESVHSVIKEIFAGKSEAIVSGNIKALVAGFEYVKQNIKEEVPDIEILTNIRKRLLMTGSDAIGAASIASGLKFYSGYPMSPSTAIMEYVAAGAKEHNILFEQAEDEISAINMAIGASFAGVRSMTATSGGGFALMIEGISLAGMTETPVVVVLTQRPGPATGFPTRTEQADLNMVLFAGHGEFARMILAPRTAAESFHAMSKAFNMAEKYQTPVIVLTDQLFNDSSYTINLPEIQLEEPKRWNVIKEFNGAKYSYIRYFLDEKLGVSPRIIPGLKDQVSYADSDEHTPQGHITEDAGIRIKMVQKRFQNKLREMEKEMEQPISTGMSQPEVLFVGWGSSFGAIREAVNDLNEKGIRADYLHFSEVFPLPEIKYDFSGAKKVICVENNASGQFAKLLHLRCGVDFDSMILKYDGRPFTSEYILGELLKQ